MARTARARASRRLGCRPLRPTLQAFLDGEVLPARAEQVTAHLASCTLCRGEAQALRRVIATLRGLRADPDLAASTRLVDSVDRIVEHEPL